MNRSDFTDANDDKLKKIVSSTSRASLAKEMIRELESGGSVMDFGQPDHFEFRKERTQVEEEKVVDVLETLAIKKMTEGIERPRRRRREDGTPADGDVRNEKKSSRKFMTGLHIGRQ